MEINTHLSPESVQNIQTVKRQPIKPLKLDEIGEWSELKLDILKKYAGVLHDPESKEPAPNLH
jgi:hypothetical protein